MLLGNSSWRPTDRTPQVRVVLTVTFRPHYLAKLHRLSFNFNCSSTQNYLVLPSSSSSPSSFSFPHRATTRSQTKQICSAASLSGPGSGNNTTNHKYYNFLDCDWKFKSTNHIQSCSWNQPISISERHETIYASFVSLLMQIFPFFYNLAILLFSEIVIFMINW